MDIRVQRLQNTNSTMDSLALLDLFPYLTRDCPLHDVSYAAILARIIVSYIGKEEITLTAVSYTPHSPDIIRAHPTETVMFQHKTCCFSNNGSFYLIEDLLSKNYWSYGFKWNYYDNNLRYINYNDINTMPALLDDDDYEQKKNNDKHNPTFKLQKYQKYLKTMENKQWEDIAEYEVDPYDHNDDGSKQIKIENICVVDLNVNHTNNNNNNNNNKRNDGSDEEKSDVNCNSNSNSNCYITHNMDNGKTSDFCWNSPMEQVDNTAMFFLLSNHRTNIYIKNQGIVKKFWMDHNASMLSKVLDVWQCNKAIYSIVKFKLSGNRTQLQLIKTYFVKTNNNINISYSKRNCNKNRKTSKKGNRKSNEKSISESQSQSECESTISKTKTKTKIQTEMTCNYKPIQKVQLKFVIYQSNSDINNISKSKNISNSKRNVSSTNINMYTNRNSGAFSICKKCNYFDSKSQTLFSVENINMKNCAKDLDKNKQKQGIIVRLISKYTVASTNKNDKNDKNNKNNKNRRYNNINNDKRSKSKSKLKLKVSRTKSVKSPKISNIDYGRSRSCTRKSNSREMKEGETIIDEIKSENIFLNLLFNQSKCHFVFYHKLSKTLVLMLKLDQSKQVNVNYNVNQDEFKENENIHTNLVNYNINSKNQNKNNGSDSINDNYGGINTADGYWNWRQNAMIENNGRLLVQLKINFKKKKLISSRIGNIIINENKCRIVAYDETRSMIVYDTLPDVKAQYQPLKDIYERNTSAEARESYMGEYQDVCILLKPRYDLWQHNPPEARIHNYKMMRLNDLVDRWIDLQI